MCSPSLRERIAFTPTPVPIEKDISRLNKLKEKSKQSDYYLSAIDIWVNKDVTKRLTAKENNLNLIEIFAKNINELKKHIIEIKDRLK